MFKQQGQPFSAQRHLNLIFAYLFCFPGGSGKSDPMAGSGISSFVSTSYLSEGKDMLDAESAYCVMEAELQNRLPYASAASHISQYIVVEFPAIDCDVCCHLNHSVWFPVTYTDVLPLPIMLLWTVISGSEP